MNASRHGATGTDHRLAVSSGSVNPSQPAGPQIFTALREAILRMEYAPGWRLSEADIGARYGASRTPVREAFMALRDADLVSTFASRGTFVTRLDATRIREAQFLREALELATVRLLTTQGLTPDRIDRLHVNVDAQRIAVTGGDDAAFQQLDDSFHLSLAAATGHPRVGHVLAREKTQLDRLRVLSLRNTEHRTRLLDEHIALLEAIESRATDRALDIARDHLRSILDVLESMTRTHEQYFTEKTSDPNPA